MSSSDSSKEVIEKLVREAIEACGPVDPGQLPHHVRERLRGQLDGSINVEEYVKRLAAERKSGADKA